MACLPTPHSIDFLALFPSQILNSGCQIKFNFLFELTPVFNMKCSHY
jgi:hypothetical protein